MSGHYYPRSTPDYSRPLFTSDQKLWAAIIVLFLIWVAK
jgi:hypothetical protein